MKRSAEEKSKLSISILATTLIIGCLGISVYPKSYSKYYDADKNVVSYTANLLRLNKGERLTTQVLGQYAGNSSDYKGVYVQLSFDRSGAMSSNDVSDKYIIEKPSACSINKINSTLSDGSKVEISEKDGYILFNTTDESHNTVTLYCTLNGEDNIDGVMTNGNLNVSTSIKEEIVKGSNAESFTYMSGSTVLNNYYNQPGNGKPVIPPGGPDITQSVLSIEVVDNPTDEQIAEYYGYFQNWYEYNISNNTIREYIQSKYPDKDSATGEEKNALLNPTAKDFADWYLAGIVIEKHENDGKTYYQYSFNNDILADASKTYLVRNDFNSDSKDHKFYLPSNNVSIAEVNATFDYYVRNYIYTGTDADNNVKMVNDYLATYTNGIADLVLNDVDIKGFTKVDDSIEISPFILDLAYNKVNGVANKRIRLSFYELIDMRENFLQNLEIVYGKDLVTDLSLITSNSDLYSKTTSSVVKNNTTFGAPVQSFSDYIFIFDTDHYLLFNVYSNASSTDVGADNQYNWVTVTELNYGSDVSLSYDNSNKTITLTVATDKLDELKNNLQSIFGGELIVQGTEDEVDGKTTGTYKIGAVVQTANNQKIPVKVETNEESKEKTTTSSTTTTKVTSTTEVTSSEVTSTTESTTTSTSTTTTSEPSTSSTTTSTTTVVEEENN